MPCWKIEASLQAINYYTYSTWNNLNRIDLFDIGNVNIMLNDYRIRWNGEYFWCHVYDTCLQHAVLADVYHRRRPKPCCARQDVASPVQNRQLNIAIAKPHSFQFNATHNQVVQLEIAAHTQPGYHPSGDSTQTYSTHADGYLIDLRHYPVTWQASCNDSKVYRWYFNSFHTREPTVSVWMSETCWFNYQHYLLPTHILLKQMTSVL